PGTAVAMTESVAPRPVLVLFAPADEPFVRGYLMPALGPAASGAPLIDAHDLATVEIDALERALAASSVTLGVLTPAFLTNLCARLRGGLASNPASARDLEVTPLVPEACPLPIHIREKARPDFRPRDDGAREPARRRAPRARPAPAA